MGSFPSMATQLLSSFGTKGDSSYTTTGVHQGLADLSIDITDTAHLSTYFQVVEFNPVFTAGKNSISFNGSSLLAVGSEIKVEVLDSAGNSLYLKAPPSSANYVDIAIFTVAIYVYEDTVAGPGKVILVGTTADGESVRWTGNISINTTYKNVSRTRFYYAPYIEVLPLLLPTIDLTTGATLGVDAILTGSCTGQSLIGATIANGPNSNYRVDLTTFSSSIGFITGFGSQLIGQNIILYVYKAKNLFNGVLDTVNSTQSFTIKSVISPTELQLDGDVVDTSTSQLAQYLAPTFIGSFYISYNQTGYLNQATSVPCVGTYNAVSHSTTIIANNTFFSASMIGTAIQVNYDTLYLGNGSSTLTLNPAISSSTNRIPITSSNYTVLTVTDPYTASITPVTYNLYSGNPHIVAPTTYTASKVLGSVTSLSSSTAYQYYTTVYSASVLLQKSYADIVFRNIDTFTGCVASQKLYAMSNIYPGEFQLVSNTQIGPNELLYDPITINKNYADIGTFYNQDQVNQYWYASSSSLSLVQSDVPGLSSMTIQAFPDYTGADGNSYVIAKVSAIGVNNDSIYYPYDQASFDDFNGTGYTSNFIFVLKNVLYSLMTDVTINKTPNVAAKVSFYLSSSSPGISGEPNFNPTYGLKIGEVSVSDITAKKVFTPQPELFFTPLNDYYGTLVIVPYQCNVTLANMSLINYGDYGFSPGGATIQVPFPINVANEAYTLKAEIYDNNANLVYTTQPIIQTFDPLGLSLFGSSIIATAGSGSSTFPSIVPNLAIENNLLLQGLTQLPSPKRFLAYDQFNGLVGYTPVSDISLIPTDANDASSVDYINVTLNDTTIGRSLAIRYSGSSPNVYGRRVYVDPSGNKTTYL